jgi:undecaprenyl pyrophosphate phosphatase UppP
MFYLNSAQHKLLLQAVKLAIEAPLCANFVVCTAAIWTLLRVVSRSPATIWRIYRASELSG